MGNSRHIPGKYILLGIQKCYEHKHRKELINFLKSNQDMGWRQHNDVNVGDGMVLIRCSGRTITGIIWWQGKIQLRVEVDVIEGRGSYHMIHL